MRRGRVVDGAVAAGLLAVVPSVLHALRVDSGRALPGRVVGAAVVDVEDVERVDVAWDVSVCLSLGLAVGLAELVVWLGRGGGCDWDGHTRAA